VVVVPPPHLAKGPPPQPAAKSIADVDFTILLSLVTGVALAENVPTDNARKSPAIRADVFNKAIGNPQGSMNERATIRLYK